MSFADITRPMRQTGTPLDSTVVTGLRDDAEDEMMEVLESNPSVYIDTSGNDRILKEASVAWTSRNILVRQKLDGTTPEFYKAGNYMEDLNIDSAIKKYDAKGHQYLQKYIRKQIGFVPLLVGEDMDE